MIKKSITTSYFNKQHLFAIVANVEILSDGKVKVTLAANATAQNTFNVLVQKA